MKTRILILILAIVAASLQVLASTVVLPLPITWTGTGSTLIASFGGPAYTPASDFTFSTNGDSTIKILTYVGTAASVSVPPVVSGLPVTEFASSLFKTNMTLLYLTLPDSVTNCAGDLCNSATNLKIVTGGNGIRTYGDYSSFNNCYALTNINISTNAYYIGNSFCYQTPLVHPVIPASVVSIADHAFAYMTGTNLWFLGNAPTKNGRGFENAGMVHYLAGATGYGTNYGGWATTVWTP